MTVEAKVKHYTEMIFTKESFLAMWNNPTLRQELPEHFEIINGRVVESVPAGDGQTYTAGDIVSILGPFVRKHKLGKITTA
jgi:hypothetical protein